MAGLLHGSARITPRVRAKFEAAQAGSRALAARYDLNPKTVLKWRRREGIADAPMGPRPRSTVLTEAEEAVVVEFRRRTLLPLNDVLGCLKDQISTLTRSALHRCLVRHGVSRLPKAEDGASKRRTFKETEIGYVHIDRLHMFLAIDRVSKFASVEFHDSPGKMEGAAFLRGVVQAFPYRILKVLTDNREAIRRRHVSGAD